ncbi:hypothetical protein CDL12_11218 [Handroanthus impetiginosus]|uniref:Uncharacterized protein n=1 Tax=Handroanthus impetiginosus TaxID=429701 RepID=A0A2G9HF54_9LAMI|nr:hypothetical protein CDL12_11218 [Handroanthus impetiginosus]
MWRIWPGLSKFLFLLYLCPEKPRKSTNCFLIVLCLPPPSLFPFFELLNCFNQTFCQAQRGLNAFRNFYNIFMSASLLEEFHKGVSFPSISYKEDFASVSHTR